MPFTLAHPAAALPFLRGRLVPSALVAGTMAPDVVYYVPRPWYPYLPSGGFMHSPLGAATAGLLVGLVLTGLWRVALRRPWLGLLPQPLADRALAATRGPVLSRHRLGRDGLVLVASVLLGLLTHLLLDLVSHDGAAMGGLGLVLEPLLSLRLPGGIALHAALQVVLSIVGMAVIGGWALRWAARHRADGARPRWSGMSLVVLAATAVGAALGAVARADVGPGALLGDAADPAHDLISGLVGAVGGGALVLLAYAALWWAYAALSRRRPRRPAAPATSPAARPASRTPG